MKTHPNALAAKCAAVNSANAEARRLYPLLVAAFAPFYGSKVIKTDGDLLASVAKVLPKLPDWQDTGNRLCVFRSRSSSYSLAFTVKASENFTREHGGESCQYHEVTIYAADLDGRNAKAPTGGGDWVLTARTDYYPEQVYQLRKVAEQKAKEAREAESALHPFGMYDR